MTTYATGCHLIRGGKLLLKMANRGISKGYWNFPGGRMEGGETPEACVAREVMEETGLRVKDLTAHGVLRFSFYGESRPSNVVYVFSTEHFSGRIKSTKEGRLRWFDIDNMPFDKMWDDDRYWFPMMLKKGRFDASFRFDRNRRVSSYSVRFR